MIDYMAHNMLVAAKEACKRADINYMACYMGAYMPVWVVRMLLACLLVHMIGCC